MLTAGVGKWFHLRFKFNSTCCNTVERGVGWGANVSTSLFNKIERMLKKMLTGPLNSLFRRSSQRSGDRKENVTERAEATLNSPVEVKRVDFVKEEKIVKITYFKR